MDVDKNSILENLQLKRIERADKWNKMFDRFISPEVEDNTVYTLDELGVKRRSSRSKSNPINMSRDQTTTINAKEILYMVMQDYLSEKFQSPEDVKDVLHDYIDFAMAIWMKLLQDTEDIEQFVSTEKKRVMNCLGSEKYVQLVKHIFNVYNSAAIHQPVNTP